MNHLRPTILVCVLVLVSQLFVSAPALAAPDGPIYAPEVISYQGQLTVEGARFEGAGYFKFALVDAEGKIVWSNAALSGGQPTLAVSLPVEHGLFDVLLGDPALPNMNTLPVSIFEKPVRRLRVWFSPKDTVGSFVQLAPDRPLASAPYALRAASADDADTLDGGHGAVFQRKAAQVVVVAKSGGDFTTITAALNSITDASDTQRYLVRVMPGVYTERVVMKPFVDIEGAGELTTRITSPGSNVLATTATVAGASNAELRFLTVECTGGANYAIAIYNDEASTRITHVTAAASGSWNTYGVYNHSSSPVMMYVTASGSKLTGDQTGATYGVYSDGDSSPAMTHLTATASGGAAGYGMYGWDSSLTIRDSVSSATGATYNYGIYITGTSSTLKVSHSHITGSYRTVGAGSGSALVGASQLNGGLVSGSAKCAGVYDENFEFYADTCP